MLKQLQKSSAGYENIEFLGFISENEKFAQEWETPI